MNFFPLSERITHNDIIVDKAKAFQLGDYFSIPYSESTAIKIKRYLERERSTPYLPYETRDLTPIELTHLNYLVLSLDAFYSQKNKFHTLRKDLIPLIVDYDGSKKLKRIRLKSFLKSADSSLVEEPSWWNETPSIFIEDIGEVYNYNYSMFWDAPDEKDYLLSQEPVLVRKDIKEKFIKFINQKIMNFIDFDEVKEEEVLLRVSSSKALHNGVSIPHYQAKSSHLNFSFKRKPGKRVFITTGPGQGRDAILNEVDDLNTVQLINENIRNVLKANCSEFILHGNAEEARKKFFRRCKKSDSFYCRDIKKEGITKPKWISREILKALNKRYPEVSAFHFNEFFDGPWFEGDKGDRGHGLGMGNELTTLMQILIFHFTNYMLGEEGYYVVAFKALFLNDDAIIFFEKSELEWYIEDFVDMDFYLCESLGILAQKDKSFFSRKCAVFCEMYYRKDCPTMNDKESYLIRESNIILRSGSILEAKFLLGNMKGSLNQIENLLKTVYSKIGYEFSVNEIDWPISCGGCRAMKLRGTDFTLQLVEGEKDIKTLSRAYQANRNRRLYRYNKDVKNFVPPIAKLYPSIYYIEEEYQNKIGLTSNYDLSCMFFRPTKERKFHSSIEKLSNKRQRAFNSAPGVPFEKFCELYSTESNYNVYIPRQFVQRYIPVKQFLLKDFRDPYKVTNPIVSFLNFIKLRNEEDLPRTSWGLYNTDASLLNEKSVFARARTFNTLSLIDRFEEDIDSEILVFPINREDIPDFMESYPRPFLTSELVVDGNMLPIPEQKFRNKDLFRRREVFGRYLEFYHIKLAQTLSWRELKYVVDFETREPSDQYDYEFWTEVFTKVKNKKDIKDELRSSSSESGSDDDDNPFKGLIIATINPAEVISNLGEDFEIHEDFKKIEVIEIIEPKKLTFEETIDLRMKEIEEKDSLNPFLIAHGPLPEGDITEYGSKGWVEWLVEQSQITMQEYLEADEDLQRAGLDVMNFKLKFSSSEVMHDHNQVLLSHLERSNNWSWITYYFNIFRSKKTEEDEIPDFDVFG